MDATTYNQCCNANPNPCCAYDYCDGSLTKQCTQEMTCQAEGAMWDVYGAACMPPVGPTCCNGNPDPCCAYVNCDASLTSTCEQEMACQAEGGTWIVVADTCVPSGDAGSSDAGSGDAGVDGDGHD